MKKILFASLISSAFLIVSLAAIDFNINNSKYKNIALDSNKIATVSTTVARYLNKDHGLDKINNGIRNVDFEYHPKYAKDDTLTFNFSGIYKIKDLVVYNRINCCKNRIQGTKVEFIYEKDNKVFVDTKIIKSKNNIIKISPNQDVSYTQVKITFAKKSQNLREIEIYAKEDFGFKLPDATEHRNIALDSSGLVELSTDVDKYLDNDHGLDKINNGIKNIDYEYYANDAKSKMLNFSFNKAYKISNMKIYNRLNYCQNRINKTIVQFIYEVGGEIIYKEDVMVSSDKEEMIKINAKNKTYNKVVVIFENSFQNLREIEIFGKEVK